MSHSLDAAGSLLSAEEFSELPEENGYVVELVRGRLVREPVPKPEHGRIEVRLAARLFVFVEQHELGVVLSNAGFIVARDPDTVRGPDIAFVSSSRVPGYSHSYWQLGPDLAVEILSPSNSARAIREKVLEYFAAGTRAVWVVDTRRKVVTVHESQSVNRALTVGDHLDGGDVLPGFRVALADLFG